MARSKRETPKDPVSGLKKGYVAGLSSSTAKARKTHWSRTSKMDPKNRAAYEPAPGDKTAKTKPSKYTKAYHAKFGEEATMDEIYIDEAADSALSKKAAASGVSVGKLRTVYKRGVAAWRTGHRPGTTPQQWGMARVNSYITKGKTYHTADKDLHEGGLWDNIHAKRERIKHGSKEHMRKPGSKGAPSKAAFKSAEYTSEAVNPAMHRARLIKRIMKAVTPHDTSKHVKTGETVELQSKNSDDPDSRFDGTNSVVKIYKKDTPGQ
jgi:Family of unknown function (DUF5824)